MPGEPSAVLRRADGQSLGCAVILFGLLTLAASCAVIDNDFASRLQQGGGRGTAMMRAIGAVRIGDFNLGFLLAAVAFIWLTLGTAKKSVDDVLVTADGDGLRFHRSIKLPPLDWSEVADVWFERALIAQTLHVAVRNGQPRKVKGIDRDQDAARAFMAAVHNRTGATLPS